MNCAGMPLTAARRANSAGIESLGDLAKGREPKWIARLVGWFLYCVFFMCSESHDSINEGGAATRGLRSSGGTYVQNNFLASDIVQLL